VAVEAEVETAVEVDGELAAVEVAEVLEAVDDNAESGTTERLE